MNIDLHVHVADVDILLNSSQTGRISKSTGYLSRLLRAVSADWLDPNGLKDVNARWLKQLAVWVRESPLDAIVILALDSVYDEDGRSRPDRTVLHVENDFVQIAAENQPEFIYGASIHPYRKDAVTELERLVKKGARLIKWIPSAQYIEPDSPKCHQLYEAMAHYNIPLLCHAGVEHMLGMRRADYNHPRRLVPALKKGVKVIAAHCGTHLFLHEPSFFNAWSILAREYEHLYGDTGAFSVVTRIPALKRILKDKELQRKLLYGSDYPGIPSPMWCWQLGFAKMGELSRISNPLVRNMRIMQALGLPAETFEHAYQKLGIQKDINK
jgi:uncharacterized protein